MVDVRQKGSLIPEEEVTSLASQLPEKEMPSFEPQKIDDSNIPDLSDESEEESEDEDREEEGKESPKVPKKKEDDEPRIPQARFNRIYGEREDYRRQAEEANQRVNKLAELLEKTLTAQQQQQIAKATPDKWKKILGEDNPLADEFYSLMQEEIKAVENRAYERAINDFDSRSQQETQALSQRTQALEDESEDFAASVGIDTSTEDGDKALTRILEIQDEETPVGADGKYSQPLIPIKTAYRLYLQELAQTKNPQKERKQQVASIVSSGRGHVEGSRNAQKGRPNPSGWRRFFDN